MFVQSLKLYILLHTHYITAHILVYINKHSHTCINIYIYIDTRTYIMLNIYIYLFIYMYQYRKFCIDGIQLFSYISLNNSTFWLNDSRVQNVIVGNMGDNTRVRYFLKLSEANPP